MKKHVLSSRRQFSLIADAMNSDRYKKIGLLSWYSRGFHYNYLIVSTDLYFKLLHLQYRN